MTEQQKTDLEESYADMIELKKEFINKMVNNGLMTEAQSEIQLERLDAMLEYHNDNSGGMFNWMMSGYGMNGNRSNMMNGNGYFRGMMGN
ncbi:MAG: DUF2680 domain-containing protein [Bacillota bacterium]|nr:DUF2680 domain-containing protein [Bacillota bacterium]